VLAERKGSRFSDGKIHDIYNAAVWKIRHDEGNAYGMEKMKTAIREREGGLIFCNLVDFDMLYGLRKDVKDSENRWRNLTAA